MKNDLHYCTRWIRYDKRALRMISEDEARNAHETRKPYTALLGDPSHPYCFVEFTEAPSIGVEFLDESIRPFFGFQFANERQGRLFLSMAKRTEYAGSADGRVTGSVFYFRVDGPLFIERFVGKTGISSAEIVATEEIDLDVRGPEFWEPYPEFGHYEGVTRRDRGIPILEEGFAK